MTNQQHPITPPSKLVEKWYEAIPGISTDRKQQLAIKAAQWGYNQALLDNISKLERKNFLKWMDTCPLINYEMTELTSNSITYKFQFNSVNSNWVVDVLNNSEE